MKKIIYILGIIAFSLNPIFAQTVTPNLGLTLPVQGSQNWGLVINADLTIIDTFSGTAAKFPSSGTGIIFSTSPNASRFATSADVVSIFGGGSCVGFLKNDGTCQVTTSGLTSFTVSNLSPLFTASLGANPTTAPALAFTLNNVAANTVFGNFTGSSANPTFSNAPVFSAANLTNFPTFNQSTTGNAATATALAASPSLCSGGQFPTGVLANGNATGCAVPPTSGITSIALTVPAYFTVSGSPLTTNGTLAISATGALTANSFLATPNGSTGALAVRTIVPADLPLATNSAFGIVKPDGTSITISAGVISSVGGNTTSTSLVTNTIPKANGPNSLINSSISDNGTTISTAEPFVSTTFVSFSSISGNGTSSVVPGATAQTGSGGTTVCLASHVCDSISGTITLATGTGSLSAGTIATVTTGITRTNFPNCSVNISGGTTFLGVGSVTSATTITISSTVALSASASYQIVYNCGGV